MVTVRPDSRIEERKQHVYPSNLGRPNVNPPSSVIQDNAELFAFTVDTDRVFFVWDPPVSWAEGDINIQIEWTNDGGVDDNGLDVKVQLDYQTYNIGDVVSGSHANSPKTVEDTYTSNSGWIFHETSVMTIAAADLIGEHGGTFKLMFTTPAGGALTCDPHLVGVLLTYDVYTNMPD